MVLFHSFISLTKIGFTITPSFATALYNVKVCNGVTDNPYPKAIQGNATPDQRFVPGCGITGFPSPLIGNPRGLFNP
jgi:hypothetical protein